MARRNWKPVAGRLLAPLLLLAAVAMAAGCGSTASDPPGEQIPGADSSAGKAAIVNYGCAACHTIPGVAGAHGTVGPPLNNFAERKYVAGVLANNPDNLIYWIRFPQQVVNGVAMPDMNVTEQDARNIAAYLYTLH